MYVNNWSCTKLLWSKPDGCQKLVSSSVGKGSYSTAQQLYKPVIVDKHGRKKRKKKRAISYSSSGATNFNVAIRLKPNKTRCPRFNCTRHSGGITAFKPFMCHSWRVCGGVALIIGVTPVWTCRPTKRHKARQSKAIREHWRKQHGFNPLWTLHWGMSVCCQCQLQITGQSLSVWGRACVVSKADWRVRCGPPAFSPPLTHRALSLHAAELKGPRKKAWKLCWSKTAALMNFSPILVVLSINPDRVVVFCFFINRSTLKVFGEYRMNAAISLEISQKCCMRKLGGESVNQFMQITGRLETFPSAWDESSRPALIKLSESKRMSPNKERRRPIGRQTPDVTMNNCDRGYLFHFSSTDTRQCTTIEC